MVLLSLALFLLTGGSDGAQLSAGPVRLFGGKARQGDVVSLLDLGEGDAPNRVIQFSWRQPSAAKTIDLQRAPKQLESLGLARPNDGSFWVLADKGRSVARFDESTGKLLHFDPLPQPSGGVWNFGPRVVFGLVQLRGGEPLLAAAGRAGFSPFTSLKGRPGNSTPETLVRNLIDCGFEESSRSPCWWLNGPSEVFFVDRDEGITVSSLPSLIDVRLLTPTPNKSPSLEYLLTELPYPIRDVLLLSRNSLWVLTNQEGSRPVTEPGAVRSRHVIRVAVGKAAKTVELPKAGLAILGGDEGGLLLLYRDGSTGWLNCQ